jgi:hypothetical protein
MTPNINIGDLRSVLTSAGLSDKGLAIKAGTVVKAQVINVAEGGNVMLRLLSAGDRREGMQGIIIKAFTEVPLAKGQNIYLEVLGGKDNIKMQVVDEMKNAQAPPQQKIPVKMLDMLVRLSEARLSNPEFKELLSMLKSLPDSVKNAIPELKGLEKLIPDAKELNGNVIRAFVETSGVAFETKLKVAVLSDPESLLRNIMALQSDGDMKGMLLKLDNILKDAEVIQTLKHAGFKAGDMSDMVEKFIKNIEFFQLTSRVNDMFYTFMPVLWEGLKDGEFLFKKKRGKGHDSYACDINLELERLGKLSVSVSSLEKAFYVSFFIEQPEVAAIVTSEKKALQERFASQGLMLKAITINQKKKVDFGKVQNRGINIKI